MCLLKDKQNESYAVKDLVQKNMTKGYAIDGSANPMAQINLVDGSQTVNIVRASSGAWRERKTFLNVKRASLSPALLR